MGTRSLSAAWQRRGWALRGGGGVSGSSTALSWSWCWDGFLESNRLLNWEEPEEQEPFVTLALLLGVQLSAYTGVSQGSFRYRRQKPSSKQPKLEGFYRLMNLKNPRRLSES